MIAVFWLFVYLIHIAVLPLLFIGLVRWLKARLQGRQGPSLYQPFWDFAKMLGKGETISETATGAFRIAPLASLASVATVSLMIPWAGVPSPIAGDLVLAVYLLAAGKFCTSLAALDTGSSFGAIGASREAAISIQAEPALLLGLGALAVHAHDSRFAAFLTPSGGEHIVILAVLAGAAAWMCAMAELSRMPIDDPTTHLELTMVHEAMILENSGRNLALIEYTVALKTTLLLGLVVQIVLLAVPLRSIAVHYIVSILLLAATAAGLAISETVMVKLSWRRVPNMLSYAIGASALACLLVAMRG
ncbi:MAG: NADH-quinone oxidoreductase subunit H [Capsulimonadaceae bacterium]|nr:NADH-quinone oxidoreductase subunit H [Capsulimonadaceae bacterium]